MRKFKIKRGQGGFTLIEIMIVVLIIGVLAAIAFAAYQRYVIKSRRATAAVCVQERAQFLERYYTTNMSYANAPGPEQCGGGLNTFYVISYSGTPDASTFTVLATPQGIQQAKDTKCGVLSLDEKGVRGISGDGTVDECW